MEKTGLLSGAGPGLLIGANPQRGAGVQTGHNFFGPRSALTKVFKFLLLNIFNPQLVESTDAKSADVES